jgi:uncharacterized repeat protein (TIGR01451 family)
VRATEPPPAGLTPDDWTRIRRGVQSSRRVASRPSQDPEEARSLGYEAELLAPDAQTFDIFGVSVSGSGDTVAVGASADDTPGGISAGSAYVFVRSGTTWTLQQHLLAADGAMGDNFGGSVSLSGDTLLIGANAKATVGGTNAGAAYVFVRSGTTWTQQQELLAADGQGFDDFGISVSLSLDTAVIGARLDDNAGGTNAGAAYVFVRSGTTWTEQQKILAPDGLPNDNFGWTVSVSGDTAVIGAMQDDNAGGTDAGAAYVFVRSGTTWTPQQKLLASDGGAYDEFGYSVSILGDTVVSGAPGPFTSGNGAAYVFVRSGVTWTEQQKLLASDGAPTDFFGHAVALTGNATVIGAQRDTNANGEDAGAAYLFIRSGTTWTEQQKLLAPDGAAFDWFGNAVSIFGDTVAIGAPFDETAAGDGAGSAHVFRESGPIDLGVTKTDGQPTAVPGLPLTYTITASNASTGAVNSAAVTDTPPPELLGASWTCVASPGSSCTPSGSGAINDAVDLAVGGTATYALTGTVAPGATGTLTNTANVATPPGIPDPNPANDSATDVDTLTPVADLALTKTDSADPVCPGGAFSYEVTAVNGGPSDATSVTVVDTLPAGVTFVSSTPGPPTCTLAGATLTCALGTLAPGSGAAVTIDVIVTAPLGTILANTAAVSGIATDPDPGNNSASAATTVICAAGELAHGTDALLDLAPQPGPIADQDLFRISQKPGASYEVVVDATSGDIGVGAGPLLERVGPDGTTVLQASSAVGTGPSRSLRWANTTAGVVDDEIVRVRSAGCATDCGSDDVYRIRAYETSYSVPRFNNSATQITVLLLQNPASYGIDGVIYFHGPSGAILANVGFSLNAKETLILDTSSVPAANGVSGSITIAHDGRYGDLSGKTVALEPGTGFSFDAALEPRAR